MTDFSRAAAITHQAASLDESAKLKDRGHRVAERESASCSLRRDGCCVLAIMDISAHAFFLADRSLRTIWVTSVRMRREDRPPSRLDLSQTSAGNAILRRPWPRAADPPVRSPMPARQKRIHARVGAARA